MSVAEVHCVALGMSAGILPAANSVPMGMSKLLSIWKPELLVGGGAGVEVDVVVEVGHLPLVSRGVCQHAQTAVEELHVSVDYLEYHLPSRGVGYAPVYGRGAGVEPYDVDAAQGPHYLVDGGISAEHPRHELQVGHR